MPTNPVRGILYSIKSLLSPASWVLYDLANTIFSFAVLSFYFPLWLKAVGGSDQIFTNALAVSYLLVFITAPVLGAISDQAPRRIPFLVITTLICIGLTFFLGSGGLLLSLVLVAIANYFYQVGLIFYDALLADVSTEKNRGLIGGIGVGLGYCGSLVGLLIGSLVLGNSTSTDRYSLVFKGIALSFLLFSLPCFFLVREKERHAFVVSPAAAAAEVLRNLRNTWGIMRRCEGLGRFLLGRVFYTDAANTLILVMAIYMTEEIGLSRTDAEKIAFVSIIAAIFGGIVWGVVVDRVGPKRTLDMVLILWMIVLASGIAVPALHLSSQFFWVIGCLAGIALGGTWSSDRPLMIRLSPRDYLGQLYGLYSMAGRFSAIVGPLLWGLIVDTLGLGRPLAVASLLIMVLISYLILLKVDDSVRAWRGEKYVPATTYLR